MGTATLRTCYGEFMLAGLSMDLCFLGILKLYVMWALKTSKTIILLFSTTASMFCHRLLSSIQPLVQSSPLSHHLQIHNHCKFFCQKTHSLHNKRDISCLQPAKPANITVIPSYLISRPIRRAVIFVLEILEKNNDECILILVIYWKKSVCYIPKISNHNIIYSS
jgi:hypothetical protein